WGAYTIVFGLAVNADNHAHVAGFVAGALFGLFVPSEARTPRWVRRAIQILGALSLAAILGAALLVMAPPGGQGGIGEPPGALEAAAWMDDFMTCQGWRDARTGGPIGAHEVDAACARVDAMRRACATFGGDDCTLLERFDRVRRAQP